MSEIHLDGGEVSVLKAMGLGGTVIDGESLLERVHGLEEAELVDTLRGLIIMGYVMSDKRSIHDTKDIQNSNFHVNSGYSRELREAIEPGKRKPQRSRRVRRE